MACDLFLYSCMTRIRLRHRAACKFTQVRPGACGGCCVCHEGAMATAQIALRAFPLAAGQDFLLYGGLIIELQPKSRGACRPAGVYGNADDRLACCPSHFAVPAAMCCGTGFTGLNCRRGVFSGGSDFFD